MIPSSLFLLCLFGFLLVFFLFFQFAFNHRRNISRKKNISLIFLLIFFIYSFYTLTKLVSSTYSEKYYVNSDYHHLEHVGFLCNDNIINLAGENLNVLNENFYGLLQIQKDSSGDLYFNTSQFNYPIYEFDDLYGDKKIVNIKEIGIPFENTFKIQLPNKIIEYKIEKFKDSVCHKIIINGVVDVVKYNKKEINISIPFHELIYNTAAKGLTQNELDLLKESFIVRESFKKPSDYSILPSGNDLLTKLKFWKKIPNNSTLYFVPGYNIKSYSITSDLSNSPQDIDCSKKFKINKGYKYVYGFLGFNDEKPFKVDLDTLENIELTYLYPHKYKLNNSIDKEERQFILSSWTGLNNCRLETGYILESNIPDSSSYNIAANSKNIISFKSGEGNEKLEINNLFTENNKWKSTALNTFYYLKSGNNKLNWIIKFVNTKDNHVLNLTVMLGILLIFISFILYLFDEFSFIQFESRAVVKPENKHNVANSIFLFVILFNILIYLLVLIKLFLIWRIASFPPLDIISLMDMSAIQEYNNLTVPNKTLFHLIVFLVLLFIIQYLFLFKNDKVNFYSEKYISLFNKLSFFNITDDGYIIICFKLLVRTVFLVLVLFIVNTIFKSPLITIIGSLFIFFINQLTVYNFTSSLFTTNIKNEFKWTYIVEKNKYPIFNYIFFIPLIPIFIFLVIFDAGFLYVFLIGILIYKLFSNIFLLFLIPSYPKVIFRKLLFIGILLVLLLVFPAKIAISSFLLFENYYVIAVSCIVLIVTLLSLYYYVDTFPVKLPRRNKLNAIKLFIINEFKIIPRFNIKNLYLYLRNFGPILLVFICSLMYFNKDYVLVQLNNKNHIRYRAEVIDRNSESISNLTGKTNYKSYSFRSLNQQYQNKWFIEHFINRSYSQVDKDFTLQNHFNKGSDYTVQTRDTIIPRYIIGEHNRFIPFVLALLMLIIIIYNFIIYPHNIYTSSGKIVTLSLSLLFAMMLFVTLTSTNLIPFFGQDFPILPTTSKVALYFPLLILFFCLLVHATKTKKINRFISITPKSGGIIFGVILLFAVPLLLLLNKKSTPEDYGLLTINEINKMKGEIEIFNSDIDSFYNYNSNCSDVQLFHKEYTAYLSQRMDINEIFVENFSRKAFQYFDENADKLNTNSIYFYTNINGKYRLEFNPNFDKINFSNNDKWTGNIISGSTFKKAVNFFDFNFKRDSLCFFDKNDIQKIELNNNFFVTYIPSNLSNNSNGYYILSTPSKSNLKLKVNSNSISKTNYIRCSSGDEIGKVITTQSPQWFGVSINDNVGPNVVMKNFKINNVRYYYYPKHNEITWVKNYADYINNLFNNNSNISKDSTFEICIDLQLNQILKNKLSNLGEGSSIAIVNNIGEIVSIADYNNKNVNPNDRKAIKLLNDKLSLRRNARSEREAFGNFALLNMISGPASSQKPLTYSAIASQLKIDWNKLIYEYNSNTNSNVIIDNQLLKYAGLDIRNNVRNNIGFLLSSHDKIQYVNYDSYITNSVNMYHSMVCYIGLYEKDKFDKSKLFKSVSNPSNIFPLVNYNGIKSTFNTNNRPLIYNYKSLERSFLNKGYVKNYAFESRLALEDTFKYNGFALPDIATIECKIQSSNNINAVKFTTLGSPKIWRVSPVAMALAYTKLFSLNNAINGTFLYKKNKLIPSFDIDTTSNSIKWNSINEYFSFVKNNIFIPMSHVVTSGTLKNVPLPSSGYYLYAKTGTLNEGSQKNEDKLLVLIISKGQIESFSTLNQLRENKFWTIYFSLPKGESDFKSTIQESYKAIIESQAFKTYMK